jgi:hypothetical protein
MAMTYATLTAAKGQPGSVYTWVNYALLDLDTIILDAQGYLFTTLRCREMRVSSTLTLSAGDTTAPLPAGFLDLISMRDKYKVGIQLIDPDKLEGERAVDSSGNIQPGWPSRVCISDEQFQFDVSMRTGVSLALRFHQLPAFVSSTNPSNFLCTRYPHLLRRAILMFSTDYVKDPESYQRHQQMLEAFLQDVMVNDDLASATEQVPIDWEY